MEENIIPSVELFGIPIIFRNATIKSVNWPQSQLAEVRAFAKKPISFWLYCGQAGRGKTYAACSVLHAFWVSGGRSARFVSASDLYLKWKDCARSFGDDLDLATKYIDCDLLVLDDLGIRTPTDAFLEFLYAIINARVNNLSGTIVTTNMTSQQMSERFGEALTSRFCSGKIIKFEGKDKRLNREF